MVDLRFTVFHRYRTGRVSREQPSSNQPIIEGGKKKEVNHRNAKRKVGKNIRILLQRRRVLCLLRGKQHCTTSIHRDSLLFGNRSGACVLSRFSSVANPPVSVSAELCLRTPAAAHPSSSPYHPCSPLSIPQHRVAVVFRAHDVTHVAFNAYNAFSAFAAFVASSLP